MQQKPLRNLFLSVGAMKAGTTWLYAALSKHPSLCFSREKELHFFYHKYVDRSLLSPERKQGNVLKRYLPQITQAPRSPAMLADNLRWCAAYLSEPTDYEWFNRVFPAHSANSYLCEFSNLTVHIPEDGWRQIIQDTENLRVMYVLRDPFKRLWSHVKFHLQYSGQLDKLNSWSLSEIVQFARQKFIWENAEYGRAIARLKSTVPADQLRIMFYEDIHADRREALRKIEDFLGINHFDLPDSVLNQRPTEGPKQSEPLGFRKVFEQDIDRIYREMTAQDVLPHPSWS